MHYTKLWGKLHSQLTVFLQHLSHSRRLSPPVHGRLWVWGEGANPDVEGSCPCCAGLAFKVLHLIAEGRVTGCVQMAGKPDI